MDQLEYPEPLEIRSRSTAGPGWRGLFSAGGALSHLKWRVACCLLRSAIVLGDAEFRPRLPVARANWAPGISIIIPECGTPGLLRRALEHLHAATGALTEPWEIIVVVNGAPAEDYNALRAGFPGVHWQFHEAALGFSGAIAKGLAAACFGGIYLHNSDMALEPEALTALLPWRAPHVFAVASQIFFDDPARRREETGWGDIRVRSGRSELFDRMPEADALVRGSLYAGGGSSLYDAGLLRRFAADTWSYAPFYWEDADWGLRAWRGGLEVLFHPGSVAWHRHRATISRLFGQEEIDRIVTRNGILFDLRSQAKIDRARHHAETSPRATLKELVSRRSLSEIRRVRAARRRAPFPDIDAERLSQHFHVRPSCPDERPLVLVVTPYCILPPRHGGAWRSWRLCEALRDRWRFILLTDEANAHSPDSWASAGIFDSIHVVGARPDGPTDRSGRIRSHSHRVLQDEFDRLVSVYRPDLVQIEHVELAGLQMPCDLPCVVSVHDVLLAPESNCQEASTLQPDWRDPNRMAAQSGPNKYGPDQQGADTNGADRHGAVRDGAVRDGADRRGSERRADLFERELLAGFSARVVCSDEDARLLAPLSATVVPNGAVIAATTSSSAGSRELLFAGPFRYPPNLSGIRTFLACVYPALRRRFPDVGLTILGGVGARSIAAADRAFSQPGVTVEEAVDDVRPWLARCAMTVNPLTGIRGSSVKLIESLAASRVCVSTREGARGFIDCAIPGLILAPDILGMLEPISGLLADEATRLALERADARKLDEFSWDAAAKHLDAVYRSLLKLDAQAESEAPCPSGPMT